MLGTGGGSLSLGGTRGRRSLLEVLESFLQIFKSPLELLESFLEILESPFELLESFLEILEDSVDKWSPLVLLVFDSALVSLIRTLFT